MRPTLTAGPALTNGSTSSGSEDAGRELRPAAALDELDERVDIHTLGRRRARPPAGWEAGLVELAAPPGRDRGALCSVWFEDGPHVQVGVAGSRVLTVAATGVGTRAAGSRNGMQPTTEASCPGVTGSTSCRWISSWRCTSPHSRSARSSPGRHTSGPPAAGLGLHAVRTRRGQLHHLPPRLDRVPLRAHDREVLDLVAFVLVFAAAVARVAAPRRASLETGGRERLSPRRPPRRARRPGGGLRRERIRSTRSPWRRRGRAAEELQVRAGRDRGRAGRDVTWENDDNFTHTIRFDDEDETAELEPATSFAHEFPEAGHVPLHLHAPPPGHGGGGASR